jgi:hypothetical protein
MQSYILIKKWAQHASRTIAFKSRLLLFNILKVDVLEILRQLILYVTIDIPETKNIHKINQIEQQTQEFQQYDAMAR